ncbi:MAG: MCP four helix bundle domain-containing protein [Magnetococcales bacterium]|nr:MCP four helix bundle domain-containing protein [Magnetococcales bacterium]
MEKLATPVFRLKLRLVTGLRALVALLVLLGTFGIFHMIQLADMTEQLYGHPFLVSTAALRITEQISHMHFLLEQVAQVRSIPELEKQIQELDERHARVLQDFKTIEERFLGDQQKVAEARQTLAEWMQMRDKMVALQKAGDADKIRFLADSYKEEELQAAHLDQLMDAVAAFSSQRAQQFMAEAQRTRDRTIGLALVVMVGCAGLGLWLSRTIRVPLQTAVQMLSSASSQMAASINQQERVVSQQSVAMTETTTTMEELDMSSRQAAEQAVRAATGAQEALDLAHQGIARVEETLQNMAVAQDSVDTIAQRTRLLSEQTGEIRLITDLVTDFANETRMLAVNAAVEAVRAGVHGRGFSVLAVETRKLADESKQSASRIHELVNQMRELTDGTIQIAEAGNDAVGGGMASSYGSVETFRSAVQAIDGAAQGAQQISLNVRQQATAIRQVTETLQAISLGTRESAAGMAQTKTGVQVLNDAAQMLKGMI